MNLPASQPDDDSVENPYASPEPTFSVPVERTDLQAAQLRHQYLIYEHRVAGVGAWFILFGMFMLVLAASFARWSIYAQTPVRIAALVLAAVLFAGACVIGVGLIRGRPWAKTPATLFVLLCLILFPCGTMIGMGAMLVLLNEDARFCLSPEYAEIVRRTPQIRAHRGLAVVMVAVTGIVIALLVSHALWW